MEKKETMQLAVPAVLWTIARDKLAFIKTNVTKFGQHVGLKDGR